MKRGLGVLFVLFARVLYAQESVPPIEWPKEIDALKATIVIYQPQPETFQGNHLTARSAVSVTMEGETEPVFGAAWLDATVATDRNARTVEVQEVKVTRVKCPDATPEQEQKFVELVSREMSGWKLKGSLDRLMATLESAEKEAQLAKNLNTKPPKILYSEQPAVLVSIDGEPILKAVEGSAIQQVINTPFQLYQDPATKTFYLRGDERWYSASDLKGEWKAETQVPEAIAKLATAPAQAGAAAAPTSAQKIVVVTEPSELIDSQGPPQWTPIAASQLSYLSNSDDTVFFDPATGLYYALFSGRWFSANASLTKAASAPAAASTGGGVWSRLVATLKPAVPAPSTAVATNAADPKALQGPWNYLAPDQLPEDFRKLPKDFPQSGILASIPGTEEAEDAAMDAQVPQTTVIDKKKAKFEPTYDGAPKFESISGTSMSYAVNTPNQITKIGDKYYAVDQGVWYVADKPEGPYQVSDVRPAEVDDLPPDNPNYNTKYVYVYDHDDDNVWAGYTAGYVGSFILGTTLGAAMTWGTGYYYRPWYGSAYYPRPWSYGYRSYYNPYTGGWAFAGPHGGAWYRPNGGNYWGPGGYHHYDRNNVNNININNNNIYNRQGNNFRNVDRDKLGQVEKGRLDKIGDRGPTAGRDHSKIAGNRPNDVFADKDGNVFRRDKEGNWQERQGKEWKNAQKPAGERFDAADKAAIKDKQPDLGSKGDIANRDRPTTQDRPKLQDKPAAHDRPQAQNRPAARERPAGQTKPASFDHDRLERDHTNRQHGDARAHNFNNYAARGGGGRGVHGGGGGGGHRGGGGRRR
jgi:hypothetical protein